MDTKRTWRPIAECPPTLWRAVLFVPDQVRWIGDPEGVADERIVTAVRYDDGAWWVDSYQGGYDVEPTHFLDPGVPEGAPEAVNPEPLRLQAEAERAVREARWVRLENDRARAAQEAAEAQDPERQRELQASYERYWSDPANWAQPPRDD